MSSTEKPKWIQGNLKTMTESGYLPMLKLDEGETKISVNLDHAPVESEAIFQGKKSERFTFIVNKGKLGYKFTVGKQLYYLILQALFQEINPMTIIRKGTGQQTQYSIKELN